MFKVNRAIAKPLYQQLIEEIEEAISSGHLAQGERLPSERDLSVWLNINRSTVIRAFDELASRNIIIKKAGSGTFVNDQKWGLLTYPSLNWRQHIIGQHSFSPAINNEKVKYDLRSGDLPVGLYPALQLPEVDWATLLRAEQQDDSSHLGILSLREEVQNYLYERFQFMVPIEQILITSGVQQAISLIALGLLKRGDAIGIEKPSHFYSLPIFQSVGLRIYGIPVDQQGICIDKLDELVHKYSLKMIFVNPHFQNPTGSVTSMRRKKDLVDFCQRKKLPIIEDDAFSQLSFYPTIDTTPIKKLDTVGNIIYLGSMSKYLGKSIRIGWMIAPEAIVNTLASIRQQLDSGLSALPQVMAESYLCYHATSHEQYLRDELKLRAEECMALLKDHLSDAYHYNTPLGGFHIYLTQKDECQRDASTVSQDLLKADILGLSGEFFGEEKDKNSARIGYVNL